MDAAYSDNLRQGGTGVGMRDHNGKLLKAQAIWYEFAASALVMEAFAVRDGVQLALDRGIREVEVETDAQQLVNLWTSSTFERSEVAGILLQVRELIGNLVSFSLKFVN